jgi:hypothetical protein
MVACENSDCPNPHEWYHPWCVGLTKIPDTWFCHLCQDTQDILDHRLPVVNQFTKEGLKSMKLAELKTLAKEHGMSPSTKFH